VGAEISNQDDEVNRNRPVVSQQHLETRNGESYSSGDMISIELIC
jgi:hypothetical protein